MNNPNLLNAIKKFKILLACLLLADVALLIAVHLFIGKFTAGMVLTAEQALLFRLLVNGIIFLMVWVQSVAFFKRIRRLKSLTAVEPRTCIVEDFIITRYKSGNDAKYNAWLLLKDPKSGELFLTYGDYSLSYYTYTVTRTSGQWKANISRKDGSKIAIGDAVRMYLKQPVSVKAEWNAEKKTLLLNGKKIFYQNENPLYGPSVFDTLQFYEGAVEVN